MFADIKYIDFEDFDVLGFDVVLEEGEYNLQLVFVTLDEESKFKEAMVIRTTVFEESLKDVGVKLNLLFDLGLFDNLTYLATGHVLGPDSAVIEMINWDHYCCPEYEIPENRILH